MSLARHKTHILAQTHLWSRSNEQVMESISFVEQTPPSGTVIVKDEMDVSGEQMIKKEYYSQLLGESSDPERPPGSREAVYFGSGSPTEVTHLVVSTSDWQETVEHLRKRWLNPGIIVTGVPLGSPDFTAKRVLDYCEGTLQAARRVSEYSNYKPSE